MRIRLLLLSWLQVALSFQDVLYYYQRLMSKTPEDLTYNVPSSRLYAEYDFIVVGAGPGGATVTNRLTEESDWTVLLLEAGMDEMGPTDIPIIAPTLQLTNYPTIDYNCRNLIGFSHIQATLRSGARCSANKAFLRPIRDRKNLHVAKFAQVTRVLIEPISKRAYGVEFRRDGRFWSTRARKEVILSAGAIQTPQLLMLSGVGPQHHLREFNIPVIHHSPGVGQNLQDHISNNELLFMVNDTVALVQPRLMFDLNAFVRYAENGTGPFTVPASTEALAFIRTEVTKTPFDYPDIEFVFGSGSIATDGGVIYKRVLGITDEIYDAIYKPLNGKDAFYMSPMLLQPTSRGWVRLKSKNPFSKPIMTSNYLKDDHDVETLVAAIKFSIQISKTRALQRFNATLLGKQIPGCRQFLFASDQYWRCSVRHLSTTVYHQSGTAKMGPATDSMAVVDPELRVYGIQGLRVVDASIIPRIPTAHTYAPTVMIGEKAADMIKRSYLRIA